MNVKGQDHSLTLVQIHSDSTFSNFVSLETARLIGVKFHVKPPWDEGTNIYSNAPGYMTNMAAMPIYSKKNFKNRLLWDQKADDLESWNAASGSRVLPNLFKWWRLVDLDLDVFSGKLKFGPLCFYKGQT